MRRTKDKGGGGGRGRKKIMVGDGGRVVSVGWNWNWNWKWKLSSTGELKFFICTLLFLCSLATVLQFLPSTSTFSLFNPSSLSQSSPSCTPIPTPTFSATNKAVSTTPTSSPSTPQQQRQQEQVLDKGIVKRGFNPYGTAAYNFILMSAYRGGLNTFAVVGLASKPLHVFGSPSYQCQWIPHFNPNNNNTLSTYAHKILPDWGYGRVYTVVVVNCTFPSPAVGDDGSGGKLILHATTNGGGDRSSNLTDAIEVLTEPPTRTTPAGGAGGGGFNVSAFTSVPPQYHYLYCGSPLYGNLSPARVREWLAYHVMLFGPKSHFVIYDAGGVHPEVLQVLRPWIDKEYVTLHDVREQERFDGYYHNQFLVVNDCLHRYRFMAKWMFFFDVDEYIFVPSKSTLKSVLDSLENYTQFTFQQMPMSNKLCLSEDAGKAFRKWGFEKLVYRDVKKKIRRDRKYAVQPRNVFAAGVHLSQNTIGKTIHLMDGRIKYFHYHGTSAERREPCRQLVNATDVTVDGTPYVMDTTMREISGHVKTFELKVIGSKLRTTRQ